MSNGESLYDILNVPTSADPKEIRKAYLKLSLRYHPDKNTDNPEAAKAQFIRIGHAYEILSDPVRRAEYDRSRRGAGGSSYYNQQSRPQPSAPSYNDVYGDDPSSSRHQQQSHEHYSYQSYSSSSSSSSRSNSYESYRQAFDANMASMSEDELRDVMGAASMIGGIVGSILGSRLVGGNNSNSSPLVRNIGSVVGGLLASGAASALVETAHGQAKERIAMEHERRERVARGEEPPYVQERSRTSADRMWKDLLQATADIVLQKTVAGMFGDRR